MGHSTTVLPERYLWHNSAVAIDDNINEKHSSFSRRGLLDRRVEQRHQGIHFSTQHRERRNTEELSGQRQKLVIHAPSLLLHALLCMQILSAVRIFHDVRQLVADERTNLSSGVSPCGCA